MIDYLALGYIITFHELGHALAGAYDGIFVKFGISPWGPTSNISKIHTHASRYLWGMGVNLLTWPIIAGVSPLFASPWFLYPCLVFGMGSFDFLLYILLVFKIGEIQEDKIVLKINLPWEKKENDSS